MKKHYLSLILLLFTLTGTYAQDLPPGDTGLFEEVQDVPVDGGLGILLVAGIGYGIKKLYAKK
ncbi:MAG: hypothetical protein V4590_08920 [Bacteroidota bacterium]